MKLLRYRGLAGTTTHPPCETARSHCLPTECDIRKRMVSAYGRQLVDIRLDPML